MVKVGFLGGGKIAQALAKGFIRAGMFREPNKAILASCHPSDVENLQAFEALGAQVSTSNETVAKQADVVVISVKPRVVPSILPQIKDYSRNKLVLSVAMGIPISLLEGGLDKSTAVIRVMPNTLALVGCAATVFVPGSTASSADIQMVQDLFSAVGLCEQVEDEDVMDIVTAVAGSGPAYIYLVIESLADGAVKMGMSRELAYKLAAQTVAGAGAMVRETGNHPGQLKDNVTSPGGCTIAAIRQLEKYRVRCAFIDAVQVATTHCALESKTE